MPMETAERSSNVSSPQAFQTLNELIDETCRRVPNHTAFITTSSRWTFVELRTSVLKAASAFKARGVRRGDCVALVLRNSPEFVIAYFGLARLGAVAVPINFMVQKPAELQFMLNDCSAVGVVTQNEFLPGLLEAKKALPALKSVWATDFEDSSRGAPANDPRARLSSNVVFEGALANKSQVQLSSNVVFEGALANKSQVQLSSNVVFEGVENFGSFINSASPLTENIPISSADTCAILYTSGTAGSPKGVMLSHANMTSNCDASLRLIEINDRDVFICILPMFHSFAWTACVLIPLRMGIKTVISPSIAPAKPWLSLMGKYGVTVFAAVPPVYSVLAKEIRGIKGLVLRYWFFRKVRFGVSGAAPLSVDVAHAFQNAMGVPILEGYGLTETSPVATINPPGRARLGSVGVAIEDVELKIINDDEKVLPTGEEGEVCIQGPNIMKGYYNQPEATRETFTKDGWFKTGDIGVLDADGYLYLRDRKKDMIIIKGLKVFSAQVEQVITSHPDVEEAAIVGIPDGIGNEIIKAFVVLRRGAAIDKAALSQFCRSKLDPYKRPRDIEIVDALPKNALQKVLKRVLRQKELDKRK